MASNTPFSSFVAEIEGVFAAQIAELSKGASIHPKMPDTGDFLEGMKRKVQREFAVDKEYIPFGERVSSFYRRALETAIDLQVDLIWLKLEYDDWSKGKYINAIDTSYEHLPFGGARWVGELFSNPLEDKDMIHFATYFLRPRVIRCPSGPVSSCL